MNDLLIFEYDYHVWRDGKYLGIATWTDDPNVGEAFLSMSINNTGELIHEVYIPDEWKLV